MKVKIISVTDFDGNEKDKRVWDSVRIMPPVEVGCRMYLWYEDNADKNGVRITTEVRAIQDGLDNTKQYFTQNSIYTLQSLE